MEFTPQSPKARHGSPIVIFVIAGLAVVAIFLRISTMMTVSANSGDIALAESTYPQIVGSRIDTCVLCHTNSIPTLNPFGAAYKAGGRGLASSLHAIENVDSDGDGWTNLQEINALTFPGNAADHPAAPTATMMPPTATSVPPTATSVPPTATKVPPTATSVPPTATRVPPTATSIPATPTLGPTNPPSDTATPNPTRTRQPRVTRTPSGTPVPCIWGDDGEREDEGGSATYSWYIGSYFKGCREWDDVTTNHFYTWDHLLTHDQFATLFGNTRHHGD